MLNEEIPTMGLSGSYHDVVRDATGRVTWDSGWRKNTIVIDCRRLLSAFMCGQQDTLGIQELWVGAGDPQWDTNGTGLPPAPNPMIPKLDDANSFSVTGLKFDYIDPETGAVSVPSDKPTNRLQIVATLGPGVPGWPEPNQDPPLHASATLREFGLVGRLAGEKVLINAVRHVAIPKDPASTLVRTIQLVF